MNKAKLNYKNTEKSLANFFISQVPPYLTQEATIKNPFPLTSSYHEPGYPVVLCSVLLRAENINLRL